MSQWLAAKARVGSPVTARLNAKLNHAVASGQNVGAPQPAIGTTLSARTTTTTVIECSLVVTLLK
jgi:hypothetical protein